MSARLGAVARIAWIGALAGACSPSAARLSLAPIALPADDPSNPCGKPADGAVNAIDVIAYTPGGEVRRSDTMIDDFPADTMQLGVEILGGEGVVLATGKTAPLDYGSLASGTQIPIAMLPLDGFCRANDMQEPRAHPLLALAGTGVLVLGGGSDSSAEYYDPATATFQTVALPDLIAGDPSTLAGASVATLADGRVVVSGNERLFVFDPSKLASGTPFSSPSSIDCRAEHASFGLDASHVLLAGGLETATCNDGMTAPLHSALAYQIDATGEITGNGLAYPPLPPTSVRYGGVFIDVGTVSDGSERLVLGGAASDPSTADQLPILPDQTGQATTATGMHAQVAALDGGAVLAAFEPDGSAQTGDAAALAPEGSVATPIADAPAWDGARLALAEDGSVLAIGGSGDVARYEPASGAWDTHTPAGDVPGALYAPSIIRLPDGSVLVVGGGAQPSATAWLYRPSLVGPASGQVFALQGADGVLTPSDESTAMRGNQTMTLTAPAAGSADDLTARALIGGPRAATGTLTAAVRLDPLGTGVPGGVALIAEQTGPSRLLVARLVPGEPARIDRIVGATATTLCTGDLVAASELGTGVGLSVTSSTVSATVGPPSSALAKVSCGFASDPIAQEAGLWGIAATANGTVEVDTIDVAR